MKEYFNYDMQDGGFKMLMSRGERNPRLSHERGRYNVLSVKKTKLTFLGPFSSTAKFNKWKIFPKF